MPCCCETSGCDRFFGARFAHRVARRYRKRGLDDTSRRIVEFLAAKGIEGATVLEVGGGVGEIEIELLRRGARRALNLELSSGYDAEANRLAAESGLADRLERRRHDIALEPGAVAPADVVVLNRVVCCYPDYERLLTAAGGRSRRLLVFSHPPRNLLSRSVVALENLWFRLTRNEFRTFAHPPESMLRVLERAGLRPVYAQRGRVWSVQGLERAA